MSQDGSSPYAFVERNVNPTLNCCFATAFTLEPGQGFCFNERRFSHWGNEASAYLGSTLQNSFRQEVEKYSEWRIHVTTSRTTTRAPSTSITLTDAPRSMSPPSVTTSTRLPLKIAAPEGRNCVMATPVQ